MMKTAVLIPARNEAPRIGAVLDRVQTALPTASVLVVDNGSIDRTPDIARTKGARVLSWPEPGYAQALAQGYRALHADGATHVIQLDADGQHPPEAALSLLVALDHADLVFGSRAGTDTQQLVARQLGSWMLASLVRRLTQLDLNDVMSGYWAVGPRALALLATRMPQGTADANIRVWAWRKGLRLAEVPVTMAARQSGRSMHDGLQGAVSFARSVRSTLHASRV
jgi:glycosyltransferase involved in cell wall biosynthesis